LQKRQKDLLRSVVLDLRHTLAGNTANGKHQRGDLDRELERLGIAPDGTIIPFDVVANPSTEETRARRVAEAELAGVPPGGRAAARTELVERAAYSWINRLLALRAMEARGLIAETLRPNPDYDGQPEALYVLAATDPARAAAADRGWWQVIEDACSGQAASLPGLFGAGDPNIALRPSIAALLHCVGALGGGQLPGFTLEEFDAAFADPDAIGWAYQFYQEEAKAQVYAKLKAGGKVTTRDEIAAATQLFTEPYMVQWLLQNSLGRSYQEAYPESTLPDTWAYYIRPDALNQPAVPTLAGLTVMDPCMGSGHFLREAFDMLVAMYREQQPELAATEIADRVLSTHLRGIDIDPRAAQLAALTLYLRARELVRDERRSRRQSGPGTYQPPAMNLATTPSRLDKGALDRHLRRHPEDVVLQDLLEEIFAVLEQADILGSLLRPEEHLNAGIDKLRRSHTQQMDSDLATVQLRASITRLIQENPADAKRLLLERVAAIFKAEAANTGDVGEQLFGREVEQGVRLVQLLDGQYAVVVTNPPYLGSGNMVLSLRRYVELQYPTGKRDLYASFILRCLEFCQFSGRVAMVTQQSWLFLRTFADLRAVPEKELSVTGESRGYRGLLRETSIERLAHLGEYAFEDASAAGAFAAMFVLAKLQPSTNHQMVGVRLIGLRSPSDKAVALRSLRAADGRAGDGTNSHVLPDRQVGLMFTQRTQALLSLPESPFVYWLSDHVLDIVSRGLSLGKVTRVVKGVSTSSESKFIRFDWETPDSRRWQPYAKGGGYRKWWGCQSYSFDWSDDGARLKAFNSELYGGVHWSKRVINTDLFGATGVVCSRVARGSLGFRIRHGEYGFDSTAIFAQARDNGQCLALLVDLNSHFATYVIRSLSPAMALESGYVGVAPISSAAHKPGPLQVASACVALAERECESNPVERAFVAVALEERDNLGSQAVRHSLEGLLDRQVMADHGLSDSEVAQVVDETGVPVAWFPLVSGFDVLGDIPGTEPAVQRLSSYDFTSPRRLPLDERGLTVLKSNVRRLFEAGPGTMKSEPEPPGASDESEDQAAPGARIPIPAETFLEELSQKLEIHPISVYWLLVELRKEGVRCKPEEQRLLEDRLSVLVLRLLGHRWPKQVEAGEIVMDWAEPSGIIPLTPGLGQVTLAERLRVRLRAEDGDLGAQQTESLLQELTGLSLEEWSRRQLFSRHVRQFKYRPIAWHLASRPASRAGGKRGRGVRVQPALECLLYYHACGGDILARLRTQHVEPLLQRTRARAEEDRQRQQESGAGEQARELEAFAAALRQVEETGFAAPELDTLLATEPLDRWSGDGQWALGSREELVHRERGWHVDLNDGVRVNIAPLQLAGLLASDVLKAADATKAIADRARWRADERRWVREGKLPRCGWLPEQVRESERWTALAPEREAEHRKLEAKRAAALARIKGEEMAGRQA